MIKHVVFSDSDRQRRLRRAGRAQPRYPPDARRPSGICPRCDRNSNFDVVGPVQLVERSTGSGSVATERVVVLRCHGRKKCTLVVEIFELGPGGMNSRPGKWIGTLWYPITGAVIDMSDVTAHLSSAFQEGVRCVSVEAPHAAVAMFRNALARIVQDKGSEEAQKKDPLVCAGQRVSVRGRLSGRAGQRSPSGRMNPTREWGQESSRILKPPLVACRWAIIRERIGAYRRPGPPRN